jgi:hypothetical protein
MTWQSEIRCNFAEISCNKYYKMKFNYRYLFSSTIKIYVLFNSIRKILLILLLWFLAEICKFLYDFFYKSFSKIFLRIQKNVYQVHKPAAVNYIIMFNYGEFLSMSNFVWRAFIKESKPWVKIKMCFWSWIAQRNIPV